MEWEKRKFLVELKLRELEFRKERILKLMGFLQTLFVVCISATVGIIFKENVLWSVLGLCSCLLLAGDIAYRYKSLELLEKRIAELRKFV